MQLHHTLDLETGTGIDILDLTPAVRAWMASQPVRSGVLVAHSRHTTTALAVNEYEERLLDDIKQFLARLAPAGEAYRHNDIALRDCPPDEPENAHSHLMALLMGSSEAIAVVDGELALGQYQSLLLFELDGPRRRTVSLQLFGEA